MLFVPGGFGTVEAMQDQEILDFLRARRFDRPLRHFGVHRRRDSRHGRTAGWLSRGVHWGFYAPLEAMGATPSHERVCVDRNRITGGGVTAGIDFGLTVVAAINGQHAAEITQLALEYDPQPPFTAGHPRTSKPEVIASVEAMMAHMISPGVELAKAYRQRAMASLATLATA